MGVHRCHTEEVEEEWECELEAEDQDSLPPLLLRTLTRTQTQGRVWVEELEVVEVSPSSAHTCSQLPSFQSINMLVGQTHL